MAIELLSPAGNYEKLETAFNYGADAAYMGMTEFSLRANAGNFSQEEVDKVKALKEKTGKKIYCTMNILFKESVKDKGELPFAFLNAVIILIEYAHVSCLSLI